MDIELFNKQLAIKVAKATNLEKRGDIKSAIDAWLEVTDMSLKFSKARGIDSTYRNMLIKRTEKIVDHIKNLKLQLVEPEKNLDVYQPIEEELEKQDLNESNQEIEDLQNSKHLELDINNKSKDIAGGIVEIKAPKDFEIITPHEELNMEIFKDNKPVIIKDENHSIDNQEDQDHQIGDKGLICFACGYNNNPPNAKICKNCNVELK